MDYKICNQLLQQAQNDFKTCLLDTIDSINFLKTKLSKAKHQPVLPHYKFNDQPLAKVCNHDRLHKSISKSKFSIKRSLMTLNNIVDQWNLLNLPYQELKALSEQFTEHENVTKLSNREYSEAMECLKEVLDHIEPMEIETKEYFDDFQYFDDEYKSLPSGS